MKKTIWTLVNGCLFLVGEDEDRAKTDWKEEVSVVIRNCGEISSDEHSVVSQKGRGGGLR